MTPAIGARFVVELARFIRDPQNTPQLFRIVEVFFETLGDKQRERLEKIYLADPGFSAMYRDGGRRYLDTPFELERMATMPPGSLGKEVATMIKANGFETEFFKKFGESRVIDYFATRLAKTHDVWHVLTGFKPDIPGEMALMGFYLAQIASPFPLSLILGGMVHLIGVRDISRLQSAIRQVLAGYRNGSRARRLYGVVWEDMWHEPVDEIRRRYCITPCQDHDRLQLRLKAGLSLGLSSDPVEWSIELPILRGARA